MINKFVGMLSNNSALSSEYAVSCNFFGCSDFEYFLNKILKRQSFCLFDIRAINIKINQTFQVVSFLCEENLYCFLYVDTTFRLQ